MADATEQSNLPAQIAEAIAGIPKALLPTSLKALDRLVGAAVDIPVAWLAQKKARIDAQTEAYTLVERSIAQRVALDVGGDEGTAKRAMEVLVRKQYRRLENREAVATAMLEDLRTQPPVDDATQIPDLEADWLNVFERYAEDASSERMQQLWGRVLAGEIRKPGRFSMRTLRFLSEFSQADALLFSDFCKSLFGDIAPNSLVKPATTSDISGLLNLESAGLIHGASGLGLQKTFKLNEKGSSFLIEGGLALQIVGVPGQKLDIACCVLTPLGQELVHLLPGRDVKLAARTVANAIKSTVSSSAYLCRIDNDRAIAMEVLWQTPPPSVPATTEPRPA